MHAPRRSHTARSAAFAFDPNADCILPIDECWLVDPRELATLADPSAAMSYEHAYARAVDELAARGMGCVPDPAAGDAHPHDVVATCVVYRVPPGDAPRRSACPHRELHLRLMCAMARSDGAFVGSELSVTLELADRIADGDAALRLRFRALVRELFLSPTVMPDPVAQLTELPRERALDVVEHLKAVAWADGCLRSAEHRMLCRVHDLLGLSRDMVGALARTTRYVDLLAA